MAPMTDAQIEEELKKLRKPALERQQPSVHQVEYPICCWGCGVFIEDGNYYCERCDDEYRYNS